MARWKMYLVQIRPKNFSIHNLCCIFEDNYIFIDNFNISSRYTSLILETNCNDKIWGTKGLNANIWGRGSRKTNTLFPVKLMQLKNVIKETVRSVNNTTENNDSYDDTRV